MRLPGWYRAISLFWLFIVVPFWWFAAAFNGYSFFSIPQLAGPAEGAGWQASLLFQLSVIVAFLAPPLLLPVAVIQARRQKRGRNAQN